MNFNQVKIDQKQKRLNLLIKQYESACRKLNKNNNDYEAPKIEEAIKDLENEIENIQKEINFLSDKSILNDENRQSMEKRDLSKKWEDDLHKIDFSKASKSLDTICSNVENQEGAALFFLHDTNTMGGKWCIKKIQDRLQQVGNWYPPMIFVFPAKPIINHLDFLYGMACKFNISTEQISESQLIHNLINKIYTALRGGHVFLIHIEIPSINDKSKFLDWFVNHFWCPLVQKLPAMSVESPLVKIFAVISIRGAINKKHLPMDIFCQKQQFDQEKFLELTLQNWTEVDIRNWLIKFSGLMSPPLEMNRQDICDMAASIHQVAGGIPRQVYDELMREMDSKIS
jgi:inactive STAND/Effector-associated domain 9